VKRRLLVRHPPTSATRAAAFPIDEPLGASGRAAAAALAAALPRRCAVVSSPALRCRQTAEAAGLRARTAAALAECDFGRWAGVVRALGAPLLAFWRIDAAPLSLTELHAHDGRWTLTRLHQPLAAGA
jgi:broad specificity phosphatase PhoE